MQRRYDFDWLKILGALLVVVAHSEMMFSPWTSAYGCIQKNKVFSEIGWNLNLWLMPLFMFLAGASVWFTLGRRSNRQYLRERILHLGLPFLVLMLIVIVPMRYGLDLWTGKFSDSFFEYALHFLDRHFTLFHLWFLAYLLVYVLVTLPLFRFLQHPAGRRLIDRLAAICERMGGLYIFALPLAIVQLALSAVPGSEFPDLGNDWARFLSLLLIFIFGYILNSDARFQSAIARQWRLTAALALLTFAPLFAIAWSDTFNPFHDLPVEYSLEYAAFWTLFVLSSWSWLLAVLGFGQRFMNVSHPLLKRATALSYPIYLLHPLLVFPAILLVAELPLNAFVAFPLLLAMVLGGTLALIAVLQRWWVTRAVLGFKTGGEGSGRWSISRLVNGRKVTLPDLLIARSNYGQIRVIVKIIAQE
jgi:fucose 4-O-acetylase-like acetyltransferase